MVEVAHWLPTISAQLGPPTEVSRRVWPLIAAQPILYGAAVVLVRYVGMATTLGSIWRPMLLVTVASLGSLLVARLVTRSWLWAALISSAFILFSLREPIQGLSLAGFALWWFGISHFRRRSGRPAPSQGIVFFVGRASGIYSVVLFAVALASAWDASLNHEPRVAQPHYEASGRGGPNMYLLLVDGYPRADTLDATFGFDNEPFLHALRQEGFETSEHARSNYNKTWLTLASMLNGRYVTDLLEGTATPGDPTVQVRWLHSLIDDASILQIPRDRGYVIKTIASPYASAALTSADEYIDYGHITEFEAQLMSQSPWSLMFRDALVSLLVSAQQQTVADSLTGTIELARSEDPSPQFVLTHVHSPHTPFVLHGPSKPTPTMPECFPRTCAFWNSTIQELQIGLPEYRNGLVQQIEGLNELLLAAVRDIVVADPNSVVIIMSDHGSRYSLEDPDEHFRTFFAARTPGIRGLFADDESPVNVLRTLFDEYLGSGTDPLPYEGWISNWGSDLDLFPYAAD